MTALMPEASAVGPVRGKAGWLRRLKDSASALYRRSRARDTELLSDHLIRDIGLRRRPR